MSMAEAPVAELRHRHSGPEPVVPPPTGCCPARQGRGAGSRLGHTVRVAWCNPWVRCLVLALILLGSPLLGAMRKDFSEEVSSLWRGAAEGEGGGGGKEDPYTLYMDGWHATPVPREVFDGPVQEQFWSIAGATSQGISVNGSEVFLPFGSFLQGTFLRDIHVIGSREFGYFNHVWWPNPVAVFGGVIEDGEDNRVRAGVAEKLHMLSQHGKWGDEALLAAEEKQRRRWQPHKSVARHPSLRLARGMLNSLFMAFSNLGSQVVYAGFDLGLRQQLRDFASHSGGAYEEASMQKLRAQRERLARRAAAVSPRANRRSSANNCMHLEGTDLRVTDRGVFLPLRRKIVSYKGQTVFTPVHRYSSLMGLLFVNYEAATDTLEMYLSASGLANIEDQQLPHAATPTFFVSPVDGEAAAATAWPLPPDGRKMKYWNTWHVVAKMAHEAMMSIPLDYEFLSLKPEVACPSERYEAVKRKVDSLATHDSVRSNPTLQGKMDIAVTIAEAADCSHPYLSAVKSKGHSLDIFENLAWGHFVLEAPDGDKMRFIAGLPDDREAWNRPPPGLLLDTTSHIEAEGADPPRSEASATEETALAACFQRLADGLSSLAASSSCPAAGVGGTAPSGPWGSWIRAKVADAGMAWELSQSLAWCVAKEEALGRNDGAH